MRRSPRTSRDGTYVSSQPAPTARLRSLDALRGFDMLWIAGLGTMLGAWADSNDWHWLDAAAAQT